MTLPRRALRSLALASLTLLLPAAPALAQRDDGVFPLIATARQLIRSGDWGKAAEAIERAETRVLTRATAPWRAEVPVERGPAARLAAARQALAKRDAGTALGNLDAAEDILRR